MRRRLLVMVIGGLALMSLLCGAGALRVWSTRGHELIMPGAADARIERRGPFRLNVVYEIPRGRSIHDLSLHLTRQGWRRITFSNTERTVLSFVRPSWPRETREILVVTLDARNHRDVDIEFSRCFRVGSWANCL